MKLRLIQKNKRGMTIGDLYSVILIIATVAILLAIMMMVFTEWQGATNINTNTTTNESLTQTELSSSSPVDGVYALCGFDDFAVSKVFNETGEIVITDGNYTVDAEDGTITNTTSTFTGGGVGNWLVTYTASYGGSDCEAIEDVVNDFTDFIPWIGIILLVIAAAIVLGVVISSFKKPRV